ncbi:hypothetical protein HDZ31DRAFT_68122 [Schizophyllum fasciatum]
MSASGKNIVLPYVRCPTLRSPPESTPTAGSQPLLAWLDSDQIKRTGPRASFVPSPGTTPSLPPLLDKGGASVCFLGRWRPGQPGSWAKRAGVTHRTNQSTCRAAVDEDGMRDNADQELSREVDDGAGVRVATTSPKMLLHGMKRLIDKRLFSKKVTHLVDEHKHCRGIATLSGVQPGFFIDAHYIQDAPHVCRFFCYFFTQGTAIIVFVNPMKKMGHVERCPLGGVRQYNALPGHEMHAKGQTVLVGWTN